MMDGLVYSKDESNLITLLRLMATMGVLTVHLNQRMPLPGYGVKLHLMVRTG